LLGALGDFRDPALVRRALDLYLSNEFDPREADTPFHAAAKAINSPDLAWSFFKEHYDAILAKMPREIVGTAPSVGGGFCDPAHRKDLADFFQDRIGKLPGGLRTLAQTLETMDLCIALRNAQEESVREFLSGYLLGRLRSRREGRLAPTCPSGRSGGAATEPGLRST
jgi:alanyl aminopeptidase